MRENLCYVKTTNDVFLSIIQIKTYQFLARLLSLMASTKLVKQDLYETQNVCD